MPAWRCHERLSGFKYAGKAQAATFTGKIATLDAGLVGKNRPASSRLNRRAQTEIEKRRPPPRHQEMRVNPDGLAIYCQGLSDAERAARMSA